MRLTKLWNRVTVLICTATLCAALASPCLGETAAGSSSRQANGCPVESKLSPKQWVCFTLPEARDVNVRLATLEGLLTAERAKKPRRLGFSVACSVGAAVDVTGSYGLVPPSCGLYWGFAFPLGHR